MTHEPALAPVHPIEIPVAPDAQQDNFVPQGRQIAPSDAPHEAVTEPEPGTKGVGSQKEGDIRRRDKAASGRAQTIMTRGPCDVGIRNHRAKLTAGGLDNDLVAHIVSGARGVDQVDMAHDACPLIRLCRNKEDFPTHQPIGQHIRLDRGILCQIKTCGANAVAHIPPVHAHVVGLAKMQVPRNRPINRRVFISSGPAFYDRGHDRQLSPRL